MTPVPTFRNERVKCTRLSSNPCPVSEYRTEFAKEKRNVVLPRPLPDDDKPVLAPFVELKINCDELTLVKSDARPLPLPVVVAFVRLKSRKPVAVISGAEPLELLAERLIVRDIGVHAAPSADDTLSTNAVSVATSFIASLPENQSSLP